MGSRGAIGDLPTRRRPRSARAVVADFIDVYRGAITARCSAHRARGDLTHVLTALASFLRSDDDAPVRAARLEDVLIALTALRGELVARTGAVDGLALFEVVEGLVLGIASRARAEASGCSASSSIVWVRAVEDDDPDATDPDGSPQRD